MAESPQRSSSQFSGSPFRSPVSRTLYQPKITHSYPTSLRDLLDDYEELEEGQEIGKCGKPGCDKPAIKVMKVIGPSINHGRLYAVCGHAGHSNYVFCTPLMHVPSRWEQCLCNPPQNATYKKDKDGRHMFQCWKEIAHGGCGFLKQSTQYVPDVLHNTDCVVCKFDPSMKKKDCGTSSNAVANDTPGSTCNLPFSVGLGMQPSSM